MSHRGTVPENTDISHTNTNNGNNTETIDADTVYIELKESEFELVRRSIRRLHSLKQIISDDFKECINILQKYIDCIGIGHDVGNYIGITATATNNNDNNDNNNDNDTDSGDDIFDIDDALRRLTSLTTGELDNLLNETWEATLDMNDLNDTKQAIQTIEAKIPI